VTPHRYITGIITERGIFTAPYGESLQQALNGAAPSSSAQ
jgi:methylthioribose-1-phosphate isomerase